MEDINVSIKKLADYAIDKHLISETEKSYSINLLLDVLNLNEYEEPSTTYSDVDLESTLANILDYAYSQKLFAENTTVYRDLFDTKVMNCFVPRPDTISAKFWNLYKDFSPKAATDWYYQFSKDSDYIRDYRVKKDLKWKTPTDYGDLDITINLSKPEKDPKAIMAARTMKQSSYPKCQLCKENMGYRGTLNHPARETIRIIPLRLYGDNFFLQYSPYSYYNEHCIVFNTEHIPMVINEKAFRHLIAFVEMFPSYMLGSNADLPIVGGSILTHDHYQGGCYDFPMFRASVVCDLHFTGYDNVEASLLKWPLTVIRLKCSDKEELIKLSTKILTVWRTYTDKSSQIEAMTNGEMHNTVTPICRKENGLFIMDLALRNNIATVEYPLGLFHPHPEYWNIKKENIGLIEVMGLAILPSRLKKELGAVKDCLLNNKNLNADPLAKKHATWVEGFIHNYDYNANNIDEILHKEVGLTFMKVLECSGVYKQTPSGYEGVARFIKAVNQA